MSTNVAVFETRLIIVQGQKKFIFIRMLNEQNQKIELDNVNMIQAAFENKLYQTLIKTMADIQNPIEVNLSDSLIKITLNVTESFNLRDGRNQSFWLYIEFADDRGEQVFKFENALDVIDAPSFS